MYEVDESGDVTNLVDSKYIDGLVLDKYYDELVLLPFANKKMSFSVSYVIEGVESKDPLVMKANLG